MISSNLLIITDFRQADCLKKPKIYWHNLFKNINTQNQQQISINLTTVIMTSKVETYKTKLGVKSHKAGVLSI